MKVGPLRRATVGDHMPPPVPSEPLPRPPEALFPSDVARASKIRPREYVGVALRAQVGHVVAYRGLSEGVFTKKMDKKGVPLFLPGV